MGELIIVTGPPGAGKSTVSGLVADSFDFSVLIPSDWFFSLWHRGAIDPWLPQALPQTTVAADTAAAATGAFARGDCQVVYDGFIPPGDLPGFAAAAGLSVLHYAVILPPVTTCTDRVASRAGRRFTSVDATRAMHRDFVQAMLDARYLITDAEAAPKDVARQILDGFSARQPPVEGTRQQPFSGIDVMAETVGDSGVSQACRASRVSSDELAETRQRLGSFDLARLGPAGGP